MNLSSLHTDGTLKSRTQLKRIKGSDVVELEIENPTTMWHPFHLHGHSFAVMGLGDNIGTRPPALPQKNNGSKPIYKDTLAIPPLGWARVRFFADNPGTWLFHCHIEYHLGMDRGLLQGH